MAFSTITLSLAAGDIGIGPAPGQPHKHEERNSAARHGFLSRKKSCSTPFLGSRLSMGAQEAMSPGLVAVELANIVLTPF